MKRDITFREHNALRHVRQRVLYDLQLDKYAPLGGDESDAKHCLEQHIIGVRAVEALDKIVGQVPADRDYDQLRWSAVSAVAGLRAAGVSEEDIDGMVKEAATREDEL